MYTDVENVFVVLSEKVVATDKDNFLTENDPVKLETLSIKMWSELSEFL